MKRKASRTSSQCAKSSRHDRTGNLDGAGAARGFYNRSKQAGYLGTAEGSTWPPVGFLRARILAISAQTVYCGQVLPRAYVRRPRSADDACGLLDRQET